MIEIPGIPAATLVVALATGNQRMTIVLSYVLIAGQSLTWEAWWVLTVIYMAFMLYQEMMRSVKD